MEAGPFDCPLYVEDFMVRLGERGAELPKSSGTNNRKVLPIEGGGFQRCWI